MKEVFILLFIELIERMGWKEEIDVNHMVKLLEPQINLLLMSLNLNEGCLKKLKNFICCISSNNTNNENVSILPNTNNP